MDWITLAAQNNQSLAVTTQVTKKHPFFLPLPRIRFAIARDECLVTEPPTEMS